MKCKILILALCVFLSVPMQSCSMSRDKADEETGTASEKVEQEEKVVLSDKQKKILADKGLSTNYDELTIPQQLAIGNIGVMLDYIEDKYDKEFVFDEYFSDEFYMQKPYMTVYAADDEQKRIVTIEEDYITDDKRIVWKDNYAELMAADEYQQAIEEYIRENIPGVEVKVLSEVDSVEAGDGDILSRAAGSSYIFMVDPFDTQDEAEEFARGLIQHLNDMKNDKAIGVYYYMQTSEQYDKVYFVSVNDFLHNSSYVTYEYRITSYNNNNTVRIEDN